MLFRNILRRVALSGASLLALAGAADAASVNFDVGFTGHVDCVRPAELANVPLNFKGRMTLKGDGTAIGKLTMTAYHVISFKTDVSGKLGGPPQAMPETPGGSVELNVLNENGLQLIIGFPNNTYTVNTEVDPGSKRCSAELVPKLKKGKTEYNIWAGDIYFYCTSFRVEGSSCKVR